MPFEDFAHETRHGAIACEIRGHEYPIGAQAFGTYRWHCRAHAETPGFIRSRTDYRTVAPPGHNDGLAAQLWIIALFDGSIKCVHVDMNDFADGHLTTILFLSS